MTNNNKGERISPERGRKEITEEGVRIWYKYSIVFKFLQFIYEKQLEFEFLDTKEGEAKKKHG